MTTTNNAAMNNEPDTAAPPIASPLPPERDTTSLIGTRFISPRHSAKVEWLVLSYHRGGAWICQEQEHKTTCGFYGDEIMPIINDDIMTTDTWYSKNTGSDQTLIISEATGANIAVTYDPKHGPLIAAAPDLLAALRIIHANAAESVEWIRRHTAEAIAKATGEEVPA